MYVCMNEFMYRYIHVCMHECICVYIYIHTYEIMTEMADMKVCMYVCIYVCMYMHRPVCVYEQNQLHTQRAHYEDRSQVLSHHLHACVNIHDMHTHIYIYIYMNRISFTHKEPTMKTGFKRSRITAMPVPGMVSQEQNLAM